MKKFFVAMMMGCAATAGAWQLPAWTSNLPEWEYNLPDTGLTPSAASITIFSDMTERHGKASTLGMQQYDLTVPLSDPRQSYVGKWNLNVAVDMQLTAMQASGTLESRDELFHFNVPISGIRKLKNGHTFVATVMPSYGSDFSTDWAAMSLGAVCDYRVNVNETLSYSLGVVFMPQRLSYWLMPMASITWKPIKDWEFAFRGYSLTAKYSVTDRLSVGGFIKGTSNSWVVEHDGADRLFNIRSLVVGFLGEYDFSRPGQRKRVVNLAIGSVVATSAEFCRMNRDKDSVELHHYHPGLYFSAGVDFRF